MQDKDATAATQEARSPVDDVTYDLLQALTSKLEAIEAYQVYAADGEEAADLFERLAADERNHATQLLDALRERLRA
jgi:rubrerythrin